MKLKITLISAILGGCLCSAQQRADLEFEPPIMSQAYAENKGPIVGIDEAHENYHTANGRYSAFAKLLRRDGYQIERLQKRFSAETLDGIDIVVIANPINKRNQKNWTLPTPSAFSKKEIHVLHDWVENGGSLLLIADHMPFPGGAGDLASSFGIHFSNGFAYPGNKVKGQRDIFRFGKGLKKNVITQGRNEDERVTRVTTFTGSAFKPPKEATPLLIFGDGSISLEPHKAWDFTKDTPGLKIDGWCQGAIMEISKGRLAIFGEAAMFTAQISSKGNQRMGMSSPEAPQNYQFLLNTMHWLSSLL